MIHGNGNEDFEWSASNHPLRYYKMEVVFHPVFFHDQETVRYNIVIESGGRLRPKMIPAFLRINQVIKWQDPKSMTLLYSNMIINIEC